jgi:hypothetical protein
LPRLRRWTRWLGYKHCTSSFVWQRWAHTWPLFSLQVWECSVWF